MTKQPFRKLGLQRNPFGSLTTSEWAEIAVVPAPIEAVFEHDTHLLLLGKKGRGKSTTLHGLLLLLPLDCQIAYERIPVGANRFEQTVDHLDCFALDEAQRLAPWCWPPLLAAARRGTRLLIGSHWNYGPLLRLAGLNVKVFRLESLATQAHMRQMLERRLMAFSLNKVPQVWFDETALDWLWQRFGDNFRAQDDFLYEVFQRLEHLGPITAMMLSRQAAAQP